MGLDERAPGSTAAVRRLTAEDVAARVLLDAVTFDEAAPKILEAICTTFGWQHGALWVVDAESDALRCAEIWTDPACRFPEFGAISRTIRFRRGMGLPGRVWASGQPAWIPDVVQDTNFPRAAIASREGLHAAVGFPIVLRDEVISVMEFFGRDVRQPDPDLLGMLTTVGHEIGLFIERRRAQEELDRFFKLSLDMLCVAGFDGYFKRVNPAWSRILGYSEAELLTRPYMELVHPDDREATITAAGRLTEGEEIVYFENRYFHRDGTTRWLLWASVPFAEQKVVYAAARDITERKAAEETLALYARDLEVAHDSLEEQASRLAQLVKELEVARQRAEQGAEAKSAFLANMSHEIRTPLNAILGMTTLALKTRLSAEQQEYLTIVKSSAESLLEIINDILDFSKIEAGRLDLDRTPFELRETVGDAAKLLALRAAEKGLELACDIAPEAPDALIGDPGRLRQVLLNVLGNAVKFTTAGEVILQVRVVEALRDQVTLQFSVRDTGIGIGPDQRDHIFQPFTQADSSTTRRYGGTGLGLAIAMRLVDLMKGRLWFESAVDEGSTFHFTGVFGRSGQATTAFPAAQPRALGGLRVLVVDDNATNRRILHELLASWRMKPVVVADVASAMARLRRAADGSRRFGLVITDCEMPDVDGFTLAERIRADRRLRDTPIVMLTSVARPDDAARCQRIGVEACLSKPVKHSDLLDTVAAVLGVSTRRPTAALEPRQAVARAARPLRVLVAEDNPVNRKLVTTVLKKRGHQVEAVENGRQVMGAARPGGRDARFDLVLMDVQMPEMGGLEATEALRAAERAAGASPVPIVALTAHALEGDRERCLAAGMNGYLAKPIDVDELIATVERMAAGAEAPAARAEGPAARRRPRVFDEAAALSHTGGDRQLLAEVAALFRGEAPRALAAIERALDRRDGEALRLAAHAFKGALAAVGSTPGRDTAAALERMGRDGRLTGAARAYRQLQRQVARLDEALVGAGLIRRRRTRSRGAARTTSSRRRRRSGKRGRS